MPIYKGLYFSHHVIPAFVPSTGSQLMVETGAPHSTQPTQTATSPAASAGAPHEKGPRQERSARTHADQRELPAPALLTLAPSPPGPPRMPMSSLHAANAPHLQVYPCSICTAVIHSAESSSSTMEHTSNQSLAFKRVKEKAESSQMPQPRPHLSIKPPQGLLPSAQTCLISLIIAFSVTLTIYIPCSDISCAFPIIFSTEELQST